MAEPNQDARAKLPAIRALVESKYDPAHYSISHVVLFGSRLHNRHKADSDYDFIILVDSATSFFEGALLLESSADRLELSIYHTSYFLDLIRQHAINVVIVPHYPKEFLIYQKFDLFERLGLWIDNPAGRRQLVNKYALRQTLESEKEFKMDKAKHCWYQIGEKYTAVKIVSHVIRYIRHATELVLTGTIASFEDGNQWWDEIITKFRSTPLEEQNWERDYEGPFGPVIADHWAKFLAVTEGTYLQTVATEQGLIENKLMPQNIPTNSRLLVLDFIDKFGHANLYRELGISLKTYQYGAAKFALAVSDPRTCSHRLHAVAECSGLVFQLDPATDRITSILASPPPLFRNYEAYASAPSSGDKAIPASLIPLISQDRLVTSHYDGLTLSMFWSPAHNKWIVATRHQIWTDAAEEGAGEYPRRRRLYRYSPWRIKSYPIYQSAGFQGNAYTEFWKTWDDVNGQCPSWPSVKERILNGSLGFAVPRPDQTSTLVSGTFTYTLTTANTIRVMQEIDEASQDMALTAVRLVYDRGDDLPLFQRYVVMDVNPIPWAKVLHCSPTQHYSTKTSLSQLLTSARNFTDTGMFKGTIVMNLNPPETGPFADTIRSRTKLLGVQYTILRNMKVDRRVFESNRPYDSQTRQYICRNLFDVIRQNTHRSYLARADFPEQWRPLHQEMEHLYKCLQLVLEQASNMDLLPLSSFSIRYQPPSQEAVTLQFDNDGKTGGPADKIKGHVQQIKQLTSIYYFLLNYPIKKLQTLVRQVLQKTTL